MKAGGCWREMPESAAKRCAAAGWGLVWAHTAFVAENEAFRLCEVGRRVEGRAKSGGGSWVGETLECLTMGAEVRAESRWAGEVGRRKCGRKIEGRGKLRG